MSGDDEGDWDDAGAGTPMVDLQAHMMCRLQDVADALGLSKGGTQVLERRILAKLKQAFLIDEHLGAERAEPGLASLRGRPVHEFRRAAREAAREAARRRAGSPRFVSQRRCRVAS